jgi:LDH2 family malate/lactate/ureidoglycolate dehydrogenase
MDTNYLSADEVKSFIAKVFVGLGMPTQDATLCADLLVRTDLSGADGHGVFRLLQYARRIKSGGINLNPQMRLLQDAPSIGLLHGDNAMGHLVMHRCAELAIAKAQVTGIGWMGCCYGNHAGAGSTYANLVSEAGLVGIYMAVGSANHMAPWGGVDPLLSTNPIAISVPTSNQQGPVVLDMATTVAAYGKVKMKAQAGEPMPVGWMIDKQGNPLTDPKRSSEGTLLPIGDYKGYGLSLMIALLAGSMNGAAVGSQLVDFNDDETAVTNTGQTIIAVNPEFLAGFQNMTQSADQLINEIKSSKPLPNVSKIRVPGDGAAQAKQKRSVDGIPIPAGLLKNLHTCAELAGIDPIQLN